MKTVGFQLHACLLGLLLVAFLVGCRPPVQWGEFVVLGQSVSVDDHNGSINYELIGKSQSDTAKKPLLVIHFFPTFDGPYGFSHEGTHAGARSADRIEISGNGVDVDVTIQWSREDRDGAGRTVTVNGYGFDFEVGKPRKLTISEKGDVVALAE